MHVVAREFGGGVVRNAGLSQTLGDIQNTATESVDKVDSGGGAFF